MDDLFLSHRWGACFGSCPSNGSKFMDLQDPSRTASPNNKKKNTATIPDQGTRSIFKFIISIFKPLMTHLCQPGISWPSDWERATQTCTRRMLSHCQHSHYALAHRKSSCDATKVLLSMAACCRSACYWCLFHHNIFWETPNTITWQPIHHTLR